MSEVKTVGSDLLDEIERVSAKRERWIGYGNPESKLVIAMMKIDIERAKSAIQSGDIAECILALQSIRGYDDE